MLHPANPECPDCGNQMTEGFLLDQSSSGNNPVYWLPGQPQTSFWYGTKTKDLKWWRTSAYRCPACGLVKTYARTPKKKKGEK